LNPADDSLKLWRSMSLIEGFETNCDSRERRQASALRAAESGT
jgi:hypothetical protein